MLLGKESKIRSREIVEKRCSSWTYKPDEEFYKIKELIKAVAENKASKMYGDTLLLLYLPFEDMYVGDHILPRRDFEDIICDLKNISYNASNVVCFIPVKVVTNSLGERELPPEIYIIK